MMELAKLTRYAVVAMLGILAGALLGWFGHNLAAPPSNVMTTAFFDDWRLICPPLRQADQSCQLRQDLVNAKSHAEIAHLMITKSARGTVLTATLPYDVLIQPGVGLSLDGGKVQASPFQTCDSTGCVARIAVDDALGKSLRGAKQGRLLFAGLDKKVLALPFSLRGFSEADSAFRSRRGP